MLHSSRLVLLAVVLTGGIMALPITPSAQSTPFMPVSEVQPGMVGIGQTVFSGDSLEEFDAHIIGVLRNVIAPGRDLIIARLAGGPLAHTGVIQGMSGSPVRIDGRLVGAVSYSLGSFSREPIAGITPIAEMVEAMREVPEGPIRSEFALTWPATAQDVYGALARLVSRAATPLPSPLRPSDIVGAPSLADWAPRLRPIGAAVMARGLTRPVADDLRAAFDPGALYTTDPGGHPAQALPSRPLRPGDPVGMTFVRGDLEMGASGTVTHVDGRQVYAFGHAFLSQGPTRMPMTQARVLTVLPSLDSSMKIGEMGPVIGRMTQDRSVGVGGVLGAGPDELAVRVRLEPTGAPARTFSFHVLHDESLTPLFAFVSILNALSGWERPAGPTTIAVRGDITYSTLGRVTIDDIFTGDAALTQAAATALTPIGTLASNAFQSVLPESLDVTLQVREDADYMTIERAWLDTVRPTFGGTHTLHIQLRQYRGGYETVSLPVTMPAQASGPVSILVSDGPTLLAREQSEWHPSAPASLDALLRHVRSTRPNHHLYVRVLVAAPGTAVRGTSQPALPGSVQTALSTDTSAPVAALGTSVAGAWHHVLPRVVRGVHELPVTLRPAR